MAGIKDFKQFLLGTPTEEMQQTEGDFVQYSIPTVTPETEQTDTNFTTTPSVTSPNTQMVSQNYTPNQTGWSLSPDGAAQFQSLLIRNTLLTVPENGDIQGAIDAIKNYGGGKIQLAGGTYYPTGDIVGASNVSIIGTGVGNTIIDFGSQNYGIKYAGNTTTAYIENFAITDLTVKDSDLTGFEEVGSRSGGIHIKYAKFFEIKNVRCTSNGDDGMKIEMGENFNVSNCQFDNSGVDGLEILGTSYYASKYFTVQNCFADTNGKDGFQTTYADVESGSFINCHSADNTQNGFYATDSEAVAYIGCSATTNGLHGYSHTAGSATFLGCFAETNTTDGFYITGGTTAITGSMARYSGNLNYNMAGSAEGQRIVFSGNIFDRLAAANPNDGAKVYDAPVISRGNAAQSTISDQNVLVSWNTTGSTINAGEVVTRKAHSSGYQIETTTTQGDPNVLGMAMYDIEDNQTSEVLSEGKTTILKVDGEEDISIGDWLQTSTVAGVAMRASTAGQTVFAKALAAYATGATGTMTALLVPPRSI